MNTPLKRTNPSVRRNLSSLCLLLFGVLLFIGGGSMKAQNINHIYTDYLGFWSSGVEKISPIKPDYSHNLLGFKVGEITYSTGVNDAILSAYGVTFQSGNYQALPVENIEITSGGDRYAMFGEMQDGLHNSVLGGGTMPFPYPKSVTLYDMLTDGIHGLDISTGVTNMRGEHDNNIEMKFPTAIENIGKIGDGVPDILVTQTAQPNSTIDKIWFTDEHENMVVGSNEISINQQQLEPLGETMNDFYDPVTGNVKSGFINSQRDLRISAYEISEFGITAENYMEAKQLVYRMGGSSDPAFVAFNTELIKILVANNDMIQMDINIPEDPKNVTIDILKNDHFPATDNIEISIVDQPSKGSVEIDPETEQVVYTPISSFTGVDTFKYEVCQDGSCDIALVTVVVGAADLEVTKSIDKQTPAVDEEVLFTVKVENHGPYDAIAVRVNDLLPPGYTMKSASVTVGSYSQLTGVWFLGTLSGDEGSATLEMRVRVNGAGPYTNTAIGESVNYDPNLDNNTASVTPGTLPSATLEVGCTSGSEFQQVNIALTGQEPLELVYSFNGGKDVTVRGITGSSLELDLGSRGSFYLKSVEDHFGNKVEYPISPSSRKHVNPCFIVSNPMMPSRDKRP